MRTIPHLRHTILGLLVVLGTSGSAWATPLYFEGPGGFGFDPTNPLGLPISLVVDGSYSFETAGDPSFSPLLEVTTSLVGVIGVEPPLPSFADPLLAEVLYTVTNTTGMILDNELLLFTLGAVDGTPDPWPAIDPDEFGLDSAGLIFVEAAPYLFGGVFLPVMAPGAMHSFSLVHVVADDLGGTIVPSPGLALLVNDNPVPEPGAASLVALALAAAALRGRRR